MTRNRASNRSETLDRIRSEPRWDVVVIGGGASGLGSALDAATRGYRTLLIEARDFAQGTSSRSTKLIHGGVRYLARGEVGLVREALHERSVLRRNAPHLVHERAFLIPAYSFWRGAEYRLGLKVYDLLGHAGKFSPSRWVSRDDARALTPTIVTRGLRGGVVYSDGQFDDARLAVALLGTFLDSGGVAPNDAPAVGFEKTDGKIGGVLFRDDETGEPLRASARVVINASGVFSDEIRARDDPRVSALVRPSRGAHIVLDRAFLPGETAIMIPRTDDGRVLFAIPWHDRVLVGTTDTATDHADVEPRASAEEISFLLDHAGRYLTQRSAGRRHPQRVRGPSASFGPKCREIDGRPVSRTRRPSLRLRPRHAGRRQVDDLSPHGEGRRRSCCKGRWIEDIRLRHRGPTNPGRRAGTSGIPGIRPILVREDSSRPARPRRRRDLRGPPRDGPSSGRFPGPAIPHAVPRRPVEPRGRPSRRGDPGGRAGIRPRMDRRRIGALLRPGRELPAEQVNRLVRSDLRPPEPSLKPPRA